MTVVDFVALSAFALYSLDTSPISNPMGTVQTLSLPPHGASIPIGPDWLLARCSQATTEFVQTINAYSQKLYPIADTLHTFYVDVTWPYLSYYTNFLKVR